MPLRSFTLGLGPCWRKRKVQAVSRRKCSMGSLMPCAHRHRPWSGWSFSLSERQ